MMNLPLSSLFLCHCPNVFEYARKRIWDSMNSSTLQFYICIHPCMLISRFMEHAQFLQMYVNFFLFCFRFLDFFLPMYETKMFMYLVQIKIELIKGIYVSSLEYLDMYVTAPQQCDVSGTQIMSDLTDRRIVFRPHYAPYS